MIGKTRSMLDDSGEWEDAFFRRTNDAFVPRFRLVWCSREVGLVLNSGNNDGRVRGESAI